MLSVLEMHAGLGYTGWPAGDASGGVAKRAVCIEGRRRADLGGTAGFGLHAVGTHHSRRTFPRYSLALSVSRRTGSLADHRDSSLNDDLAWRRIPRFLW